MLVLDHDLDLEQLGLLQSLNRLWFLLDSDGGGIFFEELPDFPQV